METCMRDLALVGRPIKQPRNREEEEKTPDAVQEHKDVDFVDIAEDEEGRIFPPSITRLSDRATKNALQN